MKFLIWKKENNVDYGWWRKDNCGYTKDISSAKVWRSWDLKKHFDDQDIILIRKNIHPKFTVVDKQLAIKWVSDNKVKW